MNYIVIDEFFSAKVAEQEAIAINGRLPTLDELLDLDIDTNHKSLIFWTKDKKDSSNYWCVNKSINFKTLQHRNCTAINTIVVFDDDTVLPAD